MYTLGMIIAICTSCLVVCIYMVGFAIEKAIDKLRATIKEVNTWR